MGLILVKIKKTTWPPADILKSSFPADKSKTNWHNVNKLLEYHFWQQRKVGIYFGENLENKMAASGHFENFVSRR